jgi:hypothetical protein
MRLYPPFPQDTVYPALAYADLFCQVPHTPMGGVLRLLGAGYLRACLVSFQ